MTNDQFPITNSNMNDTGPTSEAQRPTPERVFREYAPRVYNLARRMLGHDADAEDVTQDVLLQVVRKLSTYRGDAEVTTWLHRVTVNAVFAHRRKKASRPEVVVPAPLDNLAHSGREVGRK